VRGDSQDKDKLLTNAKLSLAQSKYNSGLIARLHGIFAYVEERDVKK
jgi:hypothetical protein